MSVDRMLICGGFDDKDDPALTQKVVEAVAGLNFVTY